MRLFIDGEWNSFGGELISMALVAEDGREFYEVIEFEAEVDPWVAENVIPKVGKPAISRKEFQIRLGQFLSQFYSVHIIADWPEDIERFCQMLITGPGERLSTPDLSMEIIRVDTVSADPHNALADARALRDWFVGQGMAGE